MSELCPHGRLTTAFCEPCGFDKQTAEFLAMDKPAGKIVKKSDQPSGSDAPYYDFPEGIRTTMDMIEWLELDFGNGNILKSLVRENNPDAKKETTALYEAEKRFYYAQRHLRRVSAMQEERAAGK